MLCFSTAFLTLDGFARDFLLSFPILMLFFDKVALVLSFGKVIFQRQKLYYFSKKKFFHKILNIFYLYGIKNKLKNISNIKKTY